MNADQLPITYRGIVYPNQCDHMGHMNVMWYVSKFDEATWQLVRLTGITTAYMKQQNRGMVAAEQHFFYKRELVAGNLVGVRTGVLEVKEKSIRFFHEMLDEETNEIAAIAVFTGVHINTELRRACAFEEAVMNRAKELVSSYKPDIKW